MFQTVVLFFLYEVIEMHGQPIVDVSLEDFGTGGER